jgi:thymidylate synthase
MVQRIVDEGVFHGDRTGVGTQSIFGHQLSFSLENGRFPMSTIRKAFFKGIFEELMWFLRGQTDSNILSQKGVKIWEGNSSREALDKIGLNHLAEGDCAAIYGFQWRHWGAKYIDCKTDYTGQGIDQISNLIKEIKTNPYSRRLLLSGWNVEALSEMCLPPCHTFYQFEVSPASDGGPDYISCQYYQRSSDVLLAGHWNITSASLLTVLLAHHCGLRPLKLVVSYGNVHIYNNHRKSISEYLQRYPFDYPTIEILTSPYENVWDYKLSDVKINRYIAHPAISLDMNA